MSSSKTIIITSQALVLIATCKPVLADDGMKTKFETFIVMAISLLSPLWCSFIKETVACVSRSLLYCLLLGCINFKMVLSSVPRSFSLLGLIGQEF